MKTIAIAIDEGSLQALDRVAAREGKISRSALIRRAVREYLARRELLEREERDREILARHRRELARDLDMLLKDQARL